jgi:hypothetical protein
MTRFIEASTAAAETTQARITKLENKIRMVEATMASFFSTVCEASPAIRADLLRIVDTMLDEFVGEETGSGLIVEHLHFLRSFINGGLNAKPYLKSLQGGKDKDKANYQNPT